MKVFISMGMKSKSTEQVRVEMEKVFAQIAKKFPDDKVELIDSIIDGADKEIALKGDDIGMWYLGESIKMMAEADLVYFIDNHNEFRGCRVERLVAENYGKMCIDFRSN